MMERKLRNILVTGGAGFIGSNFIQQRFIDPTFKGNIVNVDKLTYAGNLDNLASIVFLFGGGRYFFSQVDICDQDQLKEIFVAHDIDTVVNFAAESHVDRSIDSPEDFIQTNIVGTFRLLEVCREFWTGRDDVLFHHVSTDEVYGEVGDGEFFLEDTPYDPHSPYSASKASSDHLVRAYHRSYGLPVTISNCSNNYGPYQFPEKFIPLMILNILNSKPLPVYGKGDNVRDWLYVGDHCSAIWNILRWGRTGETYNIGGENEWTNIDLLNYLCERISYIKCKNLEHYKNLITFVNDRPGHDGRYAIDPTKIKNELSWKQKYSFNEGMDLTIKWYMENTTWVKRIISGEYKDWIEKNYSNRGQGGRNESCNK